MVSIQQTRYLMSKLSQQRGFLEKQIVQLPEMLPACLILRYRARGTRDFQSTREFGKLPQGKTYAYLTYLEKGVTKHRYIPKDKMVELAKLTESYRSFCQKMQQLRQLNKRIVELLEKSGKGRQKDVYDTVEKETKRKK